MEFALHCPLLGQNYTVQFRSSTIKQGTSQQYYAFTPFFSLICNIKHPGNKFLKADRKPGVLMVSRETVEVGRPYRSSLVPYV